MEIMDIVMFFGDFLHRYGYYALFFIFFLGIIGFPVPEETLLVFAGFLVYTGHFDYVPAVTVSFLGTVSAMTAAYWIGRRLGYPFLLRYGKKFFIKEKFIHKTEYWFNRVGKFALPIGYYIPGVRQFSAYLAGINRMRWWEFVIYTYTGGLVWSALFVTLGFVLGQNWQLIIHTLTHTIGWVAAAVLLAFIAASVFIYLFRRKRMNSNSS